MVRRPWSLLLASLLLPGLLIGCMPGATSAPPPTPTFWPTAVVPEKPIYTVERGRVVDSLTFTGRVSPEREEELYFRTDGRVLDVYVERGDAVETGERLAELDVAALYRQLEQAELAVETAQTDLDRAEAEREHDLARARLDRELEQIALAKLQGHDSSADLAVVEAELTAARIALQRAQSKYDQVAHEPDIAMRREAEVLQDATLAYARAQAAYDQAVRQAAEQRYEVETQQTRVKRAQLEVERLEAGAERAQLEQAVTRAELELADLQAQITDTLILAPFPGVITALSTAPGKAVEGFRPVMVVADPAQLEVTAELSSDEMRDLSEGQEATVTSASYPGQDLPGTIRLLPYPYGSGGSATGVDEEDQNTHVAVDLSALQAEPGDLVRVMVVLERKNDVLWLPPAAIRTFEGRKFVVLQEGAGQRQVDVTLGIESDERTEIEAGLDEGQVVLGP